MIKWINNPKPRTFWVLFGAFYFALLCGWIWFIGEVLDRGGEKAEWAVFAFMVICLAGIVALARGGNQR